MGKIEENKGFLEQVAMVRIEEVRVLQEDHPEKSSQGQIRSQGADERADAALHTETSRCVGRFEEARFEKVRYGKVRYEKVKDIGISR